MTVYQVRRTAARTMTFMNDNHNYCKLLVSYNTPVAAIMGTRGFIIDHFISNTTSTHIHEFFTGNIYDRQTQKNQEYFNTVLEMAKAQNENYRTERV